MPQSHFHIIGPIPFTGRSNWWRWCTCKAVWRLEEQFAWRCLVEEGHAWCRRGQVPHLLTQPEGHREGKGGGGGDGPCPEGCWVGQVPGVSGLVWQEVGLCHPGCYWGGKAGRKFFRQVIKINNFYSITLACLHLHQFRTWGHWRSSNGTTWGGKRGRGEIKSHWGKGKRCSERIAENIADPAARWVDCSISFSSFLIAKRL